MKTQRVYFAVLNRGWLRCELVTTVLPAIQKTEGVELVMESPAQAWGHPAASNRNALVRRFLRSDCDWLLMLDEDIIPLHNPVQMVWAGKDILGSPARVRQEGWMLHWGVYLKDPAAERYTPVNLETQDPKTELLKVDVIGTGCILIRRKVLEALKAPFHCEYDEHGILTCDVNFAFCRKAAAAGFEIWTCRNHWCEHVADDVGLLDLEGYERIERIGNDNVPYQMSWGRWSIPSFDWAFLKDVLAGYGVRTVLEFGCGLSSLLLSAHAEVESFEVDDQFRRAIAAKCGPENKLVIRLWDGVDCRPSRKHFDLAFVDGPRGKSTGGMGRQHSMRLAAQYADVVVVHDAGRSDEQHWQREYLWQDFELVRWSACHQGRCNLWVRSKRT
jgi:hypothetical protein